MANHRFEMVTSDGVQLVIKVASPTTYWWYNFRGATRFFGHSDGSGNQEYAAEVAAFLKSNGIILVKKEEHA